jgi:hypothetical protein
LRLFGDIGALIAHISLSDDADRYGDSHTSRDRAEVLRRDLAEGWAEGSSGP